MAKDTVVILVNASAKEGSPEKEKEFKADHAAAILKYQETHPAVKADWSIKPDQGYTYENGTIAQSNTGKVKNTPANSSNTGSAQP